MMDWGKFFHQILEEDYEDSALIKMFLLVWGFGGKQRQLMAATGGRGGGEGGVRVWVASGEEKRVKIVFFTLKNIFIIYKSCFESSSR